MIKKHTRQKLFDDSFAYEPNELVLVPALELVSELIDYDRLKVKHEQLVRAYEILKIRYEMKECEMPVYRAYSVVA